jgi:hypothetical protein
MIHTRAEITSHVLKQSLLRDDITYHQCVGWYGNLYDAETKDALIESLCKKEKVE